MKSEKLAFILVQIALISLHEDDKYDCMELIKEGIEGGSLAIARGLLADAQTIWTP